MTDKLPLQFPTTFPIKAMGKATNEFEVAVLTIIHKHIPDLAEAAISTKASKDGNFLSITTTFTATSQEQLDAIYLELHASEHVLFTL